MPYFLKILPDSLNLLCLLELLKAAPTQTYLVKCKARNIFIVDNCAIKNIVIWRFKGVYRSKLVDL